MQVGFALLAEHISEDRDGKLSIIGIFDQIYATAAPFSHPKMFAVVRLEGRVSEGSEHVVRLVIVDEDGHAIVEKSPPLPVLLAPRGPAMPMRGEVVTEFIGTVFQHFGDYEFNVFLNDDPTPIATVPFSTMAMDRPN